jgi:hypothetical protein
VSISIIDIYSLPNLGGFHYEITDYNKTAEQQRAIGEIIQIRPDYERLSVSGSIHSKTLTEIDNKHCNIKTKRDYFNK